MIVAPQDFCSDALIAIPNGGLLWHGSRGAGEVRLGIVVRYVDNTDGSGAIVWLTGDQAFSLQPFSAKVNTLTLRVPIGSLGVELKTPLVAAEQRWGKGHLLLASDGAYLVVEGKPQGFSEAFYIKTADWTVATETPGDVGVEVADWRLLGNHQALSPEILVAVGNWA